METIEQSIEVNVPIQRVYNQWTQFEDFPEFMEGVEEIQQLDDKKLRWVAKIGGKREEWDAEITEQIPDEKIVWKSITGKHNAGAVFFDKIHDNETKVRVVITYEPEGALQKTADALGLAAARIKGDLKRFKEFIESRGHETGAWRGEIHGGQVSREAETSARSKRLHGQQVPGTGGPKGTT